MSGNRQGVEETELKQEKCREMQIINVDEVRAYLERLRARYYKHGMSCIHVWNSS
jgi:hypothetical protein